MDEDYQWEIDKWYTIEEFGDKVDIYNHTSGMVKGYDNPTYYNNMNDKHLWVYPLLGFGYHYVNGSFNTTVNTTYAGGYLADVAVNMTESANKTEIRSWLPGNINLTYYGRSWNCDNIGYIEYHSSSEVQIYNITEYVCDMGLITLNITQIEPATDTPNYFFIAQNG